MSIGQIEVHGGLFKTTSPSSTKLQFQVVDYTIGFAVQRL